MYFSGFMSEHGNALAWKRKICSTAIRDTFWKRPVLSVLIFSLFRRCKLVKIKPCVIFWKDVYLKKQLLQEIQILGCFSYLSVLEFFGSPHVIFFTLFRVFFTFLCKNRHICIFVKVANCTANVITINFNKLRNCVTNSKKIKNQYFIFTKCCNMACPLKSLHRISLFYVRNIVSRFVALR